jgi:hypothetical protein
LGLAPCPILGPDCIEKVELERLGADFFEYAPEQLAIYRTPKRLTFLTPIEFVEV